MTYAQPIMIITIRIAAMSLASKIIPSGPPRQSYAEWKELLGIGLVYTVFVQISLIVEDYLGRDDKSSGEGLRRVKFGLILSKIHIETRKYVL